MVLGVMIVAALFFALMLGVTANEEAPSKKYKTQITQAKQKRAEAVAGVRKVIDERGDKEMRAEDEEKVDKYEKDIEALDKRINALETASRDDDDEKDDEDDEERDDEDDKKKKEKEKDDDDDEDEERSTVLINGKRYLPLGKNGKVKAQQRDKNTGKLIPYVGETAEDFSKRERRSKVEYRDAFLRYCLNGERAVYHAMEKRAVQADVDYTGGFLVMPQQFVQTLIKACDNLLWIRKLATKFQVQSAQSLGAPTLDTDPDDSDWTSELATGNEDSSFAFGKRELIPYPLAKRLKVSNKLLRMAAVSSTFTVFNSEEAGKGTGPIENFLISRLAYKNAVPQEKAFMTGDGVNKPLGLFVNSTRGISSSRDVATGSATNFTADGLIASKYNQKQQYHKTSKWLFSRTAIKLIRQLKDSESRYIWMPGITDTQPDKLLDAEVMMSEYCPSTFTDQSYVGMYGDFSFYWIVDSLEYMIQKLVELYAEANQTGFISRCEVDGMPVLEEAFTRLKCSA